MTRDKKTKPKFGFCGCAGPESRNFGRGTPDLPDTEVGFPKPQTKQFKFNMILNKNMYFLKHKTQT